MAALVLFFVRSDTNSVARLLSPSLFACRHASRIDSFKIRSEFEADVLSFTFILLLPSCFWNFEHCTIKEKRPPVSASPLNVILSNINLSNSVNMLPKFSPVRFPIIALALDAFDPACVVNDRN